MTNCILRQQTRYSAPERLAGWPSSIIPPLYLCSLSLPFVSSLTLALCISFSHLPHPTFPTLSPILPLLFPFFSSSLYAFLLFWLLCPSLIHPDHRFSFKVYVEGEAHSFDSNHCSLSLLQSLLLINNLFPSNLNANSPKSQIKHLYHVKGSTAEN